MKHSLRVEILPGWDPVSGVLLEMVRTFHPGIRIDTLQPFYCIETSDGDSEESLIEEVAGYPSLVVDNDDFSEVHSELRVEVRNFPLHLNLPPSLLLQKASQLYLRCTGSFDSDREREELRTFLDAAVSEKAGTMSTSFVEIPDVNDSESVSRSFRTYQELRADLNAEGKPATLADLSSIVRRWRERMDSILPFRGDGDGPHKPDLFFCCRTEGPSRIPYHEAYSSVLESLGKLAAAGYDPDHATLILFTGTLPGDLTMILLGLLQAQLDFGVTVLHFGYLPELSDSLCTWAVAAGGGEALSVPSGFQRVGSEVLLFESGTNGYGLPDHQAFLENVRFIREMATEGIVRSIRPIDTVGWEEALRKSSSSGNFHLSSPPNLSSESGYGGFIVEVDQTEDWEGLIQLPGVVHLGTLITG